MAAGLGPIVVGQTSSTLFLVTPGLLLGLVQGLVLRRFVALPIWIGATLVGALVGLGLAMAVGLATAPDSAARSRLEPAEERLLAWLRRGIAQSVDLGVLAAVGALPVGAAQGLALRRSFLPVVELALAGAVGGFVLFATASLLVLLLSPEGLARLLSPTLPGETLLRAIERVREPPLGRAVEGVLWLIALGLVGALSYGLLTGGAVVRALRRPSGGDGG